MKKGDRDYIPPVLRQFLSCSDNFRNDFFLNGKKIKDVRIDRVKKYKQKFNRDVVAEVIYSNKIETGADYHIFYNSHKNEYEIPSLDTLTRRMFKGWTEAYLYAYKKIDINTTKSKLKSKDYELNMIRQFSKLKIFDNKRLIEVRKEMPDMILSNSELKKLFGDMSNLFCFALELNLDAMLEKYIYLKIELGRFPNQNDCKKQDDLDFSMLLQYYTKPEIISIVNQLEPIFLKRSKNLECNKV